MRLLAVIVAVLVAAASACASPREQASELDVQLVEDAVRVAVAAENEGDVETFLEYWTDEGLEEYDVGSREEVESGRVEIGAERVTIVEFTDTSVGGDEATTTVDVIAGFHPLAAPVSRVRFELVEREGAWLLNGFEFLGGIPAPEGTTVVDIEAREYAYALGRDEVPGELAFRFSNVGAEAHEITLLRGPDDVTIEQATEVLQGVEGDDLSGVPEGYVADGVAFAQPNETVNVTFRRDLDPGPYVLACFLPEGGLGEEGEADPDARTHLQLGMVEILGVR